MQTVWISDITLLDFMKIERTKSEERKKNIVHLLIALFNNTITCIADKIQMILYYILLQYPMQNSILFLFCSMSLTYIKFFTMMQNIYEILTWHFAHANANEIEIEASSCLLFFGMWVFVCNSSENQKISYEHAATIEHTFFWNKLKCKHASKWLCVAFWYISFTSIVSYKNNNAI